ncbi:MAG: glutamine-hydrolyzing GMP synthase, partial [Sphingomonas sp.]|nr:glutamine-hydrolyzing GMP synthase [Sphingomonas sp.]
MEHPHSILIVDFGSQVTQLIARRVREAGVYSEIAPFQSAAAAFERMKPAGVILSGGPASVLDEGSPRIPQEILESGLPLFGICYGQQALMEQLGGTVERGNSGEFGEAFIDIADRCSLFDAVWREGERHQVWMSHGDKVTALPPGFSVMASNAATPIAAMMDETRGFYGVQFHPEVTHTRQGKALLERFVRDICGCPGDWTMPGFAEQAIERIRTAVDGEAVILGLSGGVDSSVAAALIHRAIGDQLTCIFVDTGLLRLNEAEQVMATFARHLGVRVDKVDASDAFFAALATVTDPEEKRKVIGREFVE